MAFLEPSGLALVFNALGGNAHPQAVGKRDDGSQRSHQVSEQTYYNWKNSVKPDLEASGDSLSTALRNSWKLKQKTVDCPSFCPKGVRDENADLRKKLGLD